ncbi:hypothetical protein KIPB_015613, partial [Kipferlia bialata]|eukprot:g15613.t1
MYKAFVKLIPIVEEELERFLAEYCADENCVLSEELEDEKSYLEN